MTFLNADYRKIINRNTIISLSFDKGFIAYIPLDNMYGDIDLILYSEFDEKVCKLHIAEQWMINRSYVGRDIYVAFPIVGEWYIMPHDTMIMHAEHSGITETRSWIDDGVYSCGWLSRILAEACMPFRLASISDLNARATIR